MLHFGLAFFFLFREALGMVGPFINTHRAASRTGTHTRWAWTAPRSVGTRATPAGTDQKALKQARCIDLQVFSKLVESDWTAT